MTLMSLRRCGCKNSNNGFVLTPDRRSWRLGRGNPKAFASTLSAWYKCYCCCTCNQGHYLIQGTRFDSRHPCTHKLLLARQLFSKNSLGESYYDKSLIFLTLAKHLALLLQVEQIPANGGHCTFEENIERTCLACIRHWVFRVFVNQSLPKN